MGDCFFIMVPIVLFCINSWKLTIECQEPITECGRSQAFARVSGNQSETCLLGFAFYFEGPNFDLIYLGIIYLWLFSILLDHAKLFGYERIFGLFNELFSIKRQSP